MVIFVGMGWASAFDFASLRAVLPEACLWWLTAGGLAYTAGALFYTRKQMLYHHVIWHLFVLAGSILHYFAILFYVIP